MPQPKRLLFVMGTRPEAIKLCPVIRHFRTSFDVRVCVTAQHRGLLDQVLEVFGIAPDHDLNAMREGQTLAQTSSRIVAALEPVLASERPDFVLVQGDTTTTLCGALAAFYAGVPVAHVEAGLRTGDPRQPFPEEMNRVLVSRLSSVHFAPTAGAAANLRAEGVADASICVTGNTGIDAVLYIRERLEQGAIHGNLPPLDPSLPLIVVTAHRRESFGEGFERLCAAIRRIADARAVQIVYPVHPNPNVIGPVRRHLEGRPRISLIEPLDYISFVDLARRAHLILTDSGGIQEEAPSLGKPVLVLRDKTERPEAVEAGTAVLVGTDVEKIVAETLRLLDDAAEYQRRSRIHNPYGDGLASERMGRFLARG